MSQKIFHDNKNERLLCFDERGNPIAPQPRSVVHKKPFRIWHGITNVGIFNSKCEILCTHRSPYVSGNPGKWQAYVGGHVKADATFFKTVRAELAEEIGLKLSSEDIKLIEEGRREDTMHIYETYAVYFDEDLSKLNFTDTEVSEARWYSFEAYLQAKEKNSDNWCNEMKSELYQKALKVLNLSI